MAPIRRILVVDDESAVCEVVAGCFEDWPGTVVDCALDGDAGSHKIRNTHYELAIIDGLLPGISGLHLAELAINENTPVLLTTGHPHLMGRLEAVNFPYLSKPFALDNLLLKSQATIADPTANIRRVRASLATLKSRADALAVVLDQSKRLMAEAARQRCELNVKI